MAKSIDISGRRFGRLIAISFSHSKDRNELWKVVCDCGVEKVIYKKTMLNGEAVSCGCKKSTAKDPVEKIKESVVIDETTGCWNWTLSKDNAGYGRLKVQMGARDKFRMTSTHRRAYEVFVGDIPKGMCVCHKCDNPSCCNPEHLFIGTHKDNMQDMISKGRQGWAKKSDAAIAAAPKEI